MTTWRGLALHNPEPIGSPSSRRISTVTRLDRPVDAVGIWTGNCSHRGWSAGLAGVQGKGDVRSRLGDESGNLDTILSESRMYFCF